MTPVPITTTPETMVARAFDIMLEHDIRHLPVLYGEKIVGLLSERDVLRAYGTSRDLKVQVADVMSKEIVAVPPTAPAWETTALMINRKIGAVLVVNERRLVGIVSAQDCLRVAHHALGGRDSGISMQLGASPIADTMGRDGGAS